MSFIPGHSQILGLGRHLPRQRVHSADLLREIDSERFDIPFDWMDQNMGIKQRRWSTNQQPSDLATKAAQDALSDANMDPTDLGAIVFAGIDRDFTEPAISHVVQHNIGAYKARCLDITNACHGFMDGINYIDLLIGSGAIKYGLVVTGEQPSVIAKNAIKALVKSTDKSHFFSMLGALSVGDAGAAMTLGPRHNGSGFQGFNTFSCGSHYRLCYYTNRNGYPEGQMKMANICAAFLKIQGSMFPKTLNHLGWQSNDIDWLVQHQVGKTPWHRHSEMMKIPPRRMSRTYPNLGNLTSATIPVNLCKLKTKSLLNPGDKVLIAGAGSGLTVSQTGYVW